MDEEIKHESILDENKGDEESWLLKRKQYITGTDVAKIMCFIDEGKTKYYDESIYDFTKNKTTTVVRSSFMNTLFSQGKLLEENYLQKAKKSWGEDSVYHNRVYTRGIFMATLDIERDDNFSIHEVYEIKLTTSANKYEEFKDRTHVAFWQVCCQLYCLPNKVQSIKIIVTPIRDIEDEEVLKISIDRDSRQYKLFMASIDKIELVYKAYKEGIEYFRMESDDSILEDTVAYYINICDEVDRLNVKVKEIKNSILESNKDKDAKHIKIPNGNYITFVDNSKDVIKEEYKDKIKAMESENKKELKLKITNEFGSDIYEKAETRTIRIIRPA